MAAGSIIDGILSPRCPYPISLKNVTSTISKGQTRKINKTSIANIVKFLLKNKIEYEFEF